MLTREFLVCNGPPIESGRGEWTGDEAIRVPVTP